MSESKIPELLSEINQVDSLIDLVSDLPSSLIIDDQVQLLRHILSEHRSDLYRELDHRTDEKIESLFD